MWKLTVGEPVTFVLLSTLGFVFLPTTGHGIVADGSVGSDSSGISFPVTLLGSEPFLACCQISHYRQSRALFLPPASWHLTDKDKLVLLFSVVLYVAWKRWSHRKFACFVLFRLIKKRSFNLLCVLDQISHVIINLCLGRVCRCDLGTVLQKRRAVKCVLICDKLWSSWGDPVRLTWC